MDNKDLIEFLRVTLIKIENAVNLLEQEPPKHIPAYHKVLGIQQKLGALPNELKNKMISQLIVTRSIINYLMNGRYKAGHAQIIKLKKALIEISISLQKNEKDNNE